MTTLNYDDLANTHGGDFIGGVCSALTAGQAVYAIGYAFFGWTGIGAVAVTTLVVADAACVAYGLSQ